MTIADYVSVYVALKVVIYHQSLIICDMTFSMCTDDRVSAATAAAATNSKQPKNNQLVIIVLVEHEKQQQHTHTQQQKKTITTTKLFAFDCGISIAHCPCCLLAPGFYVICYVYVCATCKRVP